MARGKSRIPEPREYILTKVCSACKEKKVWARYSPRTKFEDGRVRAVSSICRECDSKRSVARGREWKRRNWRHYLDYTNEYKRNRRREMREEMQGNMGKSNLLPARPFQEWLARYIEDGGELNKLSRLSGVPDRSFRRILYEGQGNVSLVLVDKVLTSMGEHIHSLYEDAT